MKICLDSGHNYSGSDTGATGNGIREQDITWYVADFLKNYLVSFGYTVIMTRPTISSNLGTSVNSSINERCRIANSNNVDYFISVHCNAGGGTGTETLIYSGGGKAEELAKIVQGEVVNGLGTKDRGVKVQNVGVLRDTNMPAILVELAFIDTVSDSNLLKNNQKDFAKAIANGFQKFIGGQSVMSEFKDVSSNHWAYNTINELQSMGIVNGDENGNIRPDDTATRAEVMQMMRNTIRYITGK